MPGEGLQPGAYDLKVAVDGREVCEESREEPERRLDAEVAGDPVDAGEHRSHRAGLQIDAPTQNPAPCRDGDAAWWRWQTC